MSDSAPAVELRNVTVRYGSLVANREVSLAIAPGEIHALVGENGAGKSTLMRALYGLAPIATGEVWVGGARIAGPSPRESIARGVGMVHQHFMLVEQFTVAENVVLGVEPPRRDFLGRLGFVDRGRAVEETRALAELHGLRVDPTRRVAELSVGEQQRVEILKVLHRGARIVILDEPTAVLSPPEAHELLAVLRRLRDRGASVLLVTHKLDEVMAVADRITVLRRGQIVARYTASEVTPAAIAHAMVGRDVAPLVRVSESTDLEKDEKPARLRVAGLSLPSRHGGHALSGIELDVRGGEILGIAGVEGNGQAELVAAIVGLLGAAGGSLRGDILLDGKSILSLDARRRRESGLGYVPEDRHLRGLLLDRSLADNLLLGREDFYRRDGVLGYAGVLDRGRLQLDAWRLLERFDVRPTDVLATARSLSGGNQQKIVLARELERSPRVLVAAQPTRGVDVGAIERIHRELDALRSLGAAVLLVSVELDELLALCDRIAVMLRGRIVATLARRDATTARLGALMTGASELENRGDKQAKTPHFSSRIGA